MRLKSGYRRILFHLFPTSSIGPIDPEPEAHSELESLFLMSMRLSQLRDSIHFTPFFSLTYLHTKYFQTRKKINPSEFNVNEIKIWIQKDPFYLFPASSIGPILYNKMYPYIVYNNTQ